MKEDERRGWILGFGCVVRGEFLKGAKRSREIGFAERECFNLG